MRLNTVCLPSSGHRRHHPCWQSPVRGGGGEGNRGGGGSKGREGGKGCRGGGDEKQETDEEEDEELTVLANHFWHIADLYDTPHICLKITPASRGNFHYHLLSCVTLVVTIKIVCLCRGYYPIPLSYPRGNYNFILCTSFAVNINPISCEMTFPSD